MAPHDSTKNMNGTLKTMNGIADTGQETLNVTKKTALPKKVYMHRNSVLTDLMEVNHLQTVYNISVAIVVLLFINSVIYYTATPNKFWEDIEMIRWGGSNLKLLGKMWICFNILAFLVFFGFKSWVRVRNKIHTKIADFVFTYLFAGASVLMFVGTSRVMLQNVFKPITHFAIMCEQVRIFMKFYSFVRECAPRVLQYKPSKDRKQEHNLYPTISHYTFFLFAPVLIYKDSYPRKKEINYKFALAQMFEFFACIFICYCGCLRFNVDVFHTAGITPFTLKELSLMLAGSMVIGALTMFVMFYAVLHSWLNLFAEILRFGDREFYQDWWNSTSFSQYYRKWNTVVHDWLYTYIYVETINAGLGRSVALMYVFFVSSLVHEYIIALSLGFFYPILAVTYLTVGVPVIFLTNKKTGQFWNTFMWSMLFSGWGFVIFFYTMEWHARRNCKGLDDPVFDFLIPRSWSASCNVISFS